MPRRPSMRARGGAAALAFCLAVILALSVSCCLVGAAFDAAPDGENSIRSTPSSSSSASAFRRTTGGNRGRAGAAGAAARKLQQASAGGSSTTPPVNAAPLEQDASAGTATVPPSTTTTGASTTAAGGTGITPDSFQEFMRLFLEQARRGEATENENLL